MSYIVDTSFDDAREFGSVIDEGWHDASLTRMWDEMSKSSGNPMLVGIFTVDSGDCKGLSVREYYPLGLPSKIGEGKLKSLGVKSGYRWEGGLPLDEFARQFVDFESPLRVSIQIRHNYSLKVGTGGWKDVKTRQEYDAWEGQKSIKPTIVRYGVANGEAELLLEASYGNPDVKEVVDEAEDDSFDYGASEDGIDSDTPF